MQLFEPLSVIYDGRCSFCIRSLSPMRAVDFFRRLRFYDLHDAERIGRMFPQLRATDLDRAMYVVTASGRVYGGIFAFRRLLWNSPLLWPLLPIFYLPGSAFAGTRIYGWVARNRGWLSCRSESCRVHTAQSATATAPERRSDYT